MKAERWELCGKGVPGGRWGGETKDVMDCGIGVCAYLLGRGLGLGGRGGGDARGRGSLLVALQCVTRGRRFESQGVTSRGIGTGNRNISTPADRM